MRRSHWTISVWWRLCPGCLLRMKALGFNYLLSQAVRIIRLSQSTPSLLAPHICELMTEVQTLRPNVTVIAL